MELRGDNRRAFNLALLTTPLALQSMHASGMETQQAPSVGPMVGHVSESSCVIWFRTANVTGPVQLVVYDASGQRIIQQLEADAHPDHDYCVRWSITNLEPATEYRYSIPRVSQTLFNTDEFAFRTAPPSKAPGKVRLAIGSCADLNPIKLWSDIENDRVDGLVLLGDTPYIDSTDLKIARRRHREFLSIKPLAKLICHTPTWATWDDHDFGGNDTNGTLKGKENTRQAFTEYRALSNFGHDGQGIYSMFRYGGLDVWLLDTRWFANTEPSPADPSQPTLLGKQQWDWLRDSLKQSTAPFKLITCGMIWDDKQNQERDDWGTYSYERQSLFEFIGREKITGVLLVGGDIHCSRLLKYKTEAVCGYPIYQLIVSPIHDRVIPKLNVAHPDLVHGSATPHVWLKLDVDTTQSPATLRAEWVQLQGEKMWTLEVNENDLS